MEVILGLDGLEGFLAATWSDLAMIQPLEIAIRFQDLVCGILIVLFLIAYPFFCIFLESII